MWILLPEQCERIIWCINKCWSNDWLIDFIYGLKYKHRTRHLPRDRHVKVHLFPTLSQTVTWQHRKTQTWTYITYNIFTEQIIAYLAYYPITNYVKLFKCLNSLIRFQNMTYHKLEIFNAQAQGCWLAAPENINPTLQLMCQIMISHFSVGTEGLWNTQEHIYPFFPLSGLCLSIPKACCSKQWVQSLTNSHNNHLSQTLTLTQP